MVGEAPNTSGEFGSSSTSTGRADAHTATSRSAVEAVRVCACVSMRGD